MRGSVFKYFYSDRQPQWEAKDARYACLSRVVRHGGWWMATVVRYSSIPGHGACSTHGLWCTWLTANTQYRPRSLL
jgi:hypothetical protein